MNKKDAPLVSIILICYNQEKFIAEALEGIFSQTYSPLEIIIVDDCSTDGTPDIIKKRLKFESNASDVHFIQNPKNLDATNSSLIGFNKARGDFFILSCGDDIMLPEMVAEMVLTWQKHQVSLVTMNASYINENSELLERTYRQLDVEADDSFETLARDGSNACCFGPAIGFERDLYKQYGWPPSYLNGFDIMMPFWAYLQKGARFINKLLFKYRIHSKNSSASLIAERSDGYEKEMALEQIYYQHLAHSLLMRDTLENLKAVSPKKYTEIANKILPLLTTQTIEMSRKLVNIRKQMHYSKLKKSATTTYSPALEESNCPNAQKSV